MFHPSPDRSQARPFEPLPDPVAQFQTWLAEAMETEPNDPNAMALATVDARGRPAVRIVLLKDLTHAGVTFFTNMHSAKGMQLAGHGFAALAMHWKTQRRQVRTEGPVTPLSTQEADAYFQTRPRLSQIGAWASDQSRPLDHRETLEQRVKAMEERFGDDPVPRPPHWGGYRLDPERFEFWQDQPFRLHDRITYTRKQDGGWDLGRLYP